MASKRLLLKPKIIVAVTLALACLLVLSALLELAQVRKEMLHVMSEEASSLIHAVAVSSDNATLAYSELEEEVAMRLLSTARMIAVMDSLGHLSETSLVRIVQDYHLYRINLFNRKGEKITGSHVSEHDDLPELHQPKTFIQSVLNGSEKQAVIGFKESRFGFGKRYAVAVGRPGGGAVVVNIDAREMLALRKEIGVGRLINDIAEKEGIHYVVIQDSSGIIVASKNVTSMSKIASDPFLRQAQLQGEPSTRLTNWQGQQIFEAAAPFVIDGSVRGLFRIGLKTDHIAEANARIERRLAMISLILLVGGLLVFNFLAIHQNYAVLDEAYLRARTYTGNILANMADAVIALDRDGKIVLFNRAAERIFATTGKDALGKNCRDLIAQDSVLEQTLRTQQGIHDFEIQYRFPAKNAILSFNTFVLRDKHGAVDSAVAVIKDLTQRRAMEEDLRRKEKLTAMGELASGVAHEVRNPLNAIGMIAQRLQKEFKPQSDAEEYRTLSQTVVNEVHRINTIIQRFLKFARPPKLNRRKTVLSELLDELVALMQPEAARKNATIRIAYGQVPAAMIDADQMKQVFLNIMQNGLQAIADGGEVAIEVRQKNGEVEIAISDTGPGIPDEIVDRIFDLYFTTKADGTGMGLSIAHQIVSAHGGRIEVDSQLGAGTCFRIKLPLDGVI